MRTDKNMGQLCFSLLILFLLIPSPATGSFADYTLCIYVGCAQSKCIPDSPYQSNVDSLFSSLANAAALSSYDAFTSAAASTSSPAYGLFQCRADLPISSCASCIRSAIDRLSALCPSAIGATIQLKGCLLRYGDDSFLGKPDTSLLYKKCGAAIPATEGGAAFLGMCNAAFAALSAGGGNDRVGGAGPVRALAQCVGDQSAEQCGDCVAAAVARLKDECGGADDGEVYLGKCYVGYWSEADESITEGTITVNGGAMTGGYRLLLVFFFTLWALAFAYLHLRPSFSMLYHFPLKLLRFVPTL